MSKYSDHTTVGGQVIAHRLRMMKQNWNVIWLVGRISFLISFLFYSLSKYQICDLWNYLCIVKANWRAGMTSIPSSLFSSSYFLFRSGNVKELSDYFIARNDAFLLVKSQIESDLWLGLKLGILIGILGIVLMVVFNKYFGKSLSDGKELISGRDYVDANTIKKEIPNKSDITLAGIPYLKDTESRHTIITGTTGAGKSNVFQEILQQILQKNERAIIVDTVGTYVNNYFRPDEDILLNPFDPRSLPWSFIKECGSNCVLLDAIAMCLIPDPIRGEKFWEQAARTVFVEAVKKMIDQGKNVSDLLQIFQKPITEQQEFLNNSFAANIISKEADRMAISVNTVLLNATNAFQYLKEGEEYFSIREWIHSGSGLLFFSCSSEQRTTLIPMITVWLTMASDVLMQTSETKKRTWFLIDELHNLNRLPRLETALAEVRKYGGCFVIGTQMVSQLNTIYGNETTKTITGLCGTKVVMNVPEPETAKYMSSFLGEKEEISTSEAISYGAHTMRDGINIAQKTERKLTVPYDEIMNLSTGEAFIKFSNIEFIAKVKFEYHELNIDI